MKEEDRVRNERLLDDYRQAVCAMLEADGFRRIENSSPKHAAIIIEEMIGHAKHSFCAVAQRMNPEKNCRYADQADTPAALFSTSRFSSIIETYDMPFS
jgi:hypothetical protein